ncbi:drug resistance transporter, EmrB/QacA subfamily [Pseudonocardia dioxanivorans CB1190]|uniref:Drug resistance transporter, EmrB/QacA subfamily n=1 Tax=Pseudonocardia dioxanivorans (strain ATCC 55486 / DSM 44775 / JCM 13855 / CB1190) TaxID=675635 RepID=F4CUY3_PSEUX|nr:drug resistance transporter, EmrB/QacA subfamily [Pseudonocardia dioxanivorans CB1190]
MSPDVDDPAVPSRTGPRPDAPARSRPGLTLLVVGSSAFLASLDLFIVNIAFPVLRVDFGANLVGLSWVLSGYTVVFAACLAPAGRLADRVGRKRLFVIGVALFAVGSAACAAAPSVGMLVAARVVQAIGAALVTPTGLALLLTAFPAQRRAFAVGVWAALGAAAGALGPPLGGLLVVASWRWVFLVNLPVCVVVLVVAPRLLRESRDASGALPDLLGALALLGGVGALAYALVEAPTAGWTDGPVLAAFVVAAALFVVLAARSRRHPAAIVDPTMLRIPTLSLSSVAMLVFSAAFAAMVFGNVMFLTGLWHDSTVVAGLEMAPGPAMVVVVAMLGSRLVQRIGPGPTAVMGALSYATGITVWVLRMTAEPDFATTMLPGQLLTGLGIGLAMPALTGVVGAVLPPDRWGAGSSMVNTTRQIGMVLGTAVIVAIYDASGGPTTLTAFRHGWTFLLCCAGLTIVCGLAVARRAGRDHDAAAQRFTGPVAAAPGRA